MSKDTNAYKSSLESIQSMKHMIQILSCSIIVCGLVVLSLVLVLGLRDRIHEMGVLLSIGKSKMEIIVQFILELVFISFPSGIILCAFSVIKHNTLCFILSHGLLMSIIIVSVLMANLMIMIKSQAKNLSLQLLPYSLIISLCFSAIVSLVYAKSIKNHVVEIKSVTNQMMALDKKARLETDSSYEIGQLKAQINDLYETHFLIRFPILNLKIKRF